MMFFSLSQQTVYFLSSIVFGAVLAALYDLVRAARMLLRCSRGHILVSDILFFFLCGVMTSLFALPFNKGNVRAFIIFGEAAGFLAYRLTLGSIFGKFYAVIARLLRCFSQKICEKLKKIYDFLLKAGTLLLYNIDAVIVGLFRTALSGVRVLAQDARQTGAQRRSARRQNKKMSRPAPQQGRGSEKGYKNGRKKNRSGKKNGETRDKARKKNKRR